MKLAGRKEALFHTAHNITTRCADSYLVFLKEQTNSWGIGLQMANQPFFRCYGTKRLMPCIVILYRTLLHSGYCYKENTGLGGFFKSELAR